MPDRLVRAPAGPLAAEPASHRRRRWNGPWSVSGWRPSPSMSGASCPCTGAATAIPRSPPTRPARSGGPAALPTARARSGSPRRPTARPRCARRPGVRGHPGCSTRCLACSARMTGRRTSLPRTRSCATRPGGTRRSGSAGRDSSSRRWCRPSWSRRWSAWRRPGPGGCCSGASASRRPVRAGRDAGAARAGHLGVHPVLGVAPGGRRGGQGPHDRRRGPGGRPDRGDRAADLGGRRPQAAGPARHRAVDLGRGQAAGLRRRRRRLGGRLPPAVDRRLGPGRAARRRRGDARAARALPRAPAPGIGPGRAGGPHPPRRGPRMAVRDYRAI